MSSWRILGGYLAATYINDPAVKNVGFPIPSSDYSEGQSHS